MGRRAKLSGKWLIFWALGGATACGGEVAGTVFGTDDPLCPTQTGSPPHWELRGIGVYGTVTPFGVSPPNYDGEAIVEVSTSNELILYRSLPGAGVDTGSAGPARVRVASERSLPVLQPGSQVWWTHTSAGDSLRDRQDGQLILGSISTFLPNHEAAPLEIETTTPICRVASNDDCVKDGRITHYTVRVAGDEAVQLLPRHDAPIRLGGVDYSVSLQLAQQETDAGSNDCWDSGSYDHRVFIDARILPRDPSLVIGEVSTAGELSACRLGNLPPFDASYWLEDATRRTWGFYNGEVRYLGQEDGAFAFEPQAFAFEPTRGGKLLVSAGASAVEEPAPGQTLWFTASSGAFGLRASETGPFLLAHAEGPNDASVTRAFGDLLGVPVTTEPSCLYENFLSAFDERITLELSDVVFDASPSVRVANGSRAEVLLGDESYEVRTRALSDQLNITLVPSRR